VVDGDTITTSQANTLLDTELQELWDEVFDIIVVEVSNSMIAALASFAFSVGPIDLEESTLLSKLNNYDFQGAADEFVKWIYSDGEEVPGLDILRASEKTLFLADPLPTFTPDTSRETDWFGPWSTKISRYFNLGEVFQMDESRRSAPQFDDTVKEKIIQLADALDQIRIQKGSISVTSWYRDLVTNTRVGGASNSHHLQGWAADIFLTGVDTSSSEALDFENWLLSNWASFCPSGCGGVGKGIANGKGFTHLDLGPVRSWNY